MDTSAELIALGKIILASFLGGLVGLEREVADKPAGLRTHMLVCATATFFVMLAPLVVSLFQTQDPVTVDPLRLINAILVGISFLGAGTIIKSNSESSVEGLTTSASILSVSAIGIAIALEAFYLAVGVALLNILINWGINFVGAAVNPNRSTDL
ncbi:MAG TPA: MgtC/SapB family protein [Anaerolineales bacterium]|nr:MgtC/SapB family protein [Anaerolineales bacterium]